MTTLRAAGVYGGIAPVQVDVDALAQLLRDKETELRATADRMRHHLAAKTSDITNGVTDDADASEPGRAVNP
jgi:hypothetical protein